MPITITAEREAEIRRFAKFIKGIGPTGDMLSELLVAWGAERAAHQETRERADSNWEALERVKGKWEAECLAHKETQAKLDAAQRQIDSWRSLGADRYEAEKKELAETQAIVRELAEALEVVRCVDCRDGILFSDSLLFDLDREDEQQVCRNCVIRGTAIAKAKAVLPAAEPTS